MEKAFVGEYITGNFQVAGEVDISSIQILRKRNDVLYAVFQGRELKLEPMDNDAKIIINNFSSRMDEENESIYKCYAFNDHLVVLLYTYQSVKRVENESETMHFYMDRGQKHILEEQGVIKNQDEVEFMETEFLNNKSVFIVEYFGGQATKTFQMYGATYWASVERERPGVFRLKKLVKYQVNNRADRLTQFFGYIKFITFDEAIRTKGFDVKASQVQTNEIFKAWDEYLDFEKALYDDEVIKFGFVKYESYRIEEDEVIIKLKKSANQYSLFAEKDLSLELEYDLVPSHAEFSPNSCEDLIEYRDNHRKEILMLGKCLSESFDDETITFALPMVALEIPVKGYLLLSDRSMNVQQRRRKDIMSIINSKRNNTSNMLMRLSAGEEDSQSGSNDDPVKDYVLRKMFGRSDVTLKENFRKAMHIAINTPDVALIQGPPGTGKTTLINGIISRLEGMSNKNYKILVSSEQHEALYNVVNKVSASTIPPFVTSQKYNEEARAEDEEKMHIIMSNFQEKFLSLCNDILNENSEKDIYAENLTKIIYLVQRVIDKNYSKMVIEETLPSIAESAMLMGVWDKIKPLIDQINAKMNQSIGGVEMDGYDFIRRKLGSQRLDYDVFIEDDGIYQLKELQRTIKRFGYTELLLELEVYERIVENPNEKDFGIYVEYINQLKGKIDPQVDEFELSLVDNKDLFQSILDEIRLHAHSKKKSFYDIIEALKYKMMDIDNIRTVISRYTNVIGSTCAQAGRSLDIIDLSSNKYDYVIIDEAARANPLDLMIPALLGIKVIMVGDQMQLPHYVETKYVRKFTEEKEMTKKFNQELLTKSLFQVVYEALEQSWNNGKLKFQRHIRIEEQHRMHPIIGDFISKQFYEGKIMNGESTSSHVNNYHVYNEKNVVWLNVPLVAGLEERHSAKLWRTCEALKVVEVLQEIIRRNRDKKLNIGIMSFYKGQVELINKLMKENFSEEVLRGIECNTVDSYQGKEFDIVILSPTRSNVETTIDKCLGFIYYSKSRINVALSRARKLLIVVGDSETMGKCEAFESYIDYVKRNGYYGG